MKSYPKTLPENEGCLPGYSDFCRTSIGVRERTREEEVKKWTYKVHFLDALNRVFIKKTR
jgi:hypothetical protein